MRQEDPPRLLSWILRRILPPERVEDVLGDLEESALRERHPRVWYWRQTASFALRLGAETARESWESVRPRTSLLSPLGLLTELRQAARAGARKPGFFLLALITLALGIGANGALFSLMDAIYLRPLPLRNPERLVKIEATSPKAYLGFVSYLEAKAIGADSSAFEEVVMVGSRGVTLHRDEERHLLRVDYVSERFFEATGIPIAMGRSFAEVESSRSDTPLMIINHRLWQERLGGREDVIGSAVQLNDTLFTVIGVTPAGFVGLDRIVQTDVWVTAEQAPFVVPGLRDELANRHQRWFELYGRIGSEASRSEAQAQLDTIAARWQQEEPQQYPDSGFRLTGVSETHRKQFREGMVLLALPALVLLIACANVANLLLARSEARRKELALRTAVGAGRARLGRQLLAESLVLALGGTAAGLVIASWATRLVSVLVPPAAITYTIDARFDLRLLVFCTALFLVVTILLTLVPASRLLKPNVVRDLKGFGAAPRAGARFPMQHVIVGAQAAIGVVVLVASSLIVRSLWYSSTLHPGFDPHKALATLYLVPALQGYDDETSCRFFEEWRQRLSALPAVDRVSYAIRLPAQSNESGWATEVAIPGTEPPPGEKTFRIRYTMVGPDYFEVMGTRILRGRGVTEADRPEGHPVVIINETMAERFWPGGDPIGTTIRVGKRTAVFREIVGIAEDIKIADLYEPPEPYLYVPYAQDPQGFGLLLVETALEPGALLGMARAEIDQLAPDVPILEAGTVALHMEMVLFEERRDAWIAVGVGLLAIVLTSGGLYTLVTMIASHRTKEIGIRVVLGANTRKVLWLVMRRGIVPALVGSAVGTGAGLLANDYLQSRVHGIATDDPLSFTLGAVVLLLAVLAGSLLPAVRAARLDPSVTMRYE
ncbi:MAG TPA: ADOP family duplicated permease [Vicinamibacteria bacterium]|nr:ADOP family duplicated permease [Vicinamibacteria bacterium]